MRIRCALGLLVAVMLVAGLACQSRTTVSAGRKTIVVTYPILGSLVRELVGSEANVITLVPNGLDPHQWEPSARDIETVNKASLVVQNGLDLEAGLQHTLETARTQGVPFFTASDYIKVRRVKPGEGVSSEDPDQAAGAADPHLWTDPLTMKSIIGPLAQRLSDEFGMDLQAQSRSLQDRLDALDAEVRSILEPIPAADRRLATGHESMGYFAERYGFQLVGEIIPSLSSQADVSAADLARLKKAINANHVKAIFTEVGTSPVVAEVIGSETGAKVVELQPVTLPSDGSYFTFMRNMAGTISDALK